MNPGSPATGCMDNPCNYSDLEVLQLPEQKQDQQDYQNHPAKAHP
jgi:hypothetical protein